MKVFINGFPRSGKNYGTLLVKVQLVECCGGYNLHISNNTNRLDNMAVCRNYLPIRRVECLLIASRAQTQMSLSAIKDIVAYLHDIKNGMKPEYGKSF